MHAGRPGERWYHGPAPHGPVIQAGWLGHPGGPGHRAFFTTHVKGAGLPSPAASLPAGLALLGLGIAVRKVVRRRALPLRRTPLLPIPRGPPAIA
jgi:hypothetical protein